MIINLSYCKRKYWTTVANLAFCLQIVALKLPFVEAEKPPYIVIVVIISQLLKNREIGCSDIRRSKKAVCMRFFANCAVSPIACGIAHRPMADVRYWLTREFFANFALKKN